jgi:HlyD family secretion protein
MKKYLFWTLGALAVIGLLVWIFAPRALEVETAIVAKGRFERAIEEDGKTRLRERYVVSTPLAGRVSRITLREGDRVENGAVIATVSPTAPTLIDARTEAEIRERIGAVEATSRRASVAVERAKAALDQASIELKRSEMLAEKGFVSPNQNETARLNARLRERELESSKQDEDATHHELRQARATLQQYFEPSATSESRRWEIIAPVGGMVLKVVQQSEDTSQMGTPLIEIGDPTKLDVVVDILTTDAAQIASGMIVQLRTGDSCGNANNGNRTSAQSVIRGRVRMIEPAAFTKVSALGVEEQRVNAVIDIEPATQTMSAIGDGFRVDVRILVQTVEDAIKVPVSAIYPVGNQHGVFVIESGRSRQRLIEIVARNSTEAIVKSGLEPGVSVIVYPPVTLKEGTRVVAKK